MIEPGNLVATVRHIVFDDNGKPIRNPIYYAPNGKNRKAIRVNIEKSRELWLQNRSECGRDPKNMYISARPENFDCEVFVLVLEENIRSRDGGRGSYIPANIPDTKSEATDIWLELHKDIVTQATFVVENQRITRRIQSWNQGESGAHVTPSNHWVKKYGNMVPTSIDGVGNSGSGVFVWDRRFNAPRLVAIYVGSIYKGRIRSHFDLNSMVNIWLPISEKNWQYVRNVQALFR